MRTWLLAASCAVALFAMTAPARAQLEFCNEAGYLITSAVAVENEEGWTVEGWFNIDPGECATVIADKLGAGPYYAFARTRPAHGAARRLTAGDRVLCTGTGDFRIVSRNGCAERGQKSVEFAKVETDGATSWTTTFAEGNTFDMKRARIAGLQRLLRDVGYDPGSVDGFDGSKTTRAIKDFQTAEGATADGVVDAKLFALLEKAAERRLRETGFHFCNDTDYLVWAAIGYRQNAEWRSSGWIRVTPGACAAAIARELEEPVYYAYAEAVTGPAPGEVVTREGVPLVWGGDRSFCTKPTRFFIRGRTNCRARGYDETPFQEVSVGDSGTYTMRLR